jgi:hypothetical protein
MRQKSPLLTIGGSGQKTGLSETNATHLTYVISSIWLGGLQISSVTGHPEGATWRSRPEPRAPGAKSGWKEKSLKVLKLSDHLMVVIVGRQAGHVLTESGSVPDDLDRPALALADNATFEVVANASGCRLGR